MGKYYTQNNICIGYILGYQFENNNWVFKYVVVM